MFFRNILTGLKESNMLLNKSLRDTLNLSVYRSQDNLCDIRHDSVSAKDTTHTNTLPMLSS